ncbi:hypothetical protein HAX54_016815, partial [Datura stramonium]|nr:hypothetical protein [Datura stramonium]
VTSRGHTGVCVQDGMPGSAYMLALCHQCPPRAPNGSYMPVERVVSKEHAMPDGTRPHHANAPTSSAASR